MESSQLMYTGYNGAYVNESQMFESFPEQSVYPSNMDYGMYQNKMQQEDVRIVQGNNTIGYSVVDGFYGGEWMGNMEQSTQKHCVPSTQQTQYSGIAATFPQPLLSLGSSYDYEYSPNAFSSYTDSTVYSNESSPCLHSYDMHLSAPQSPITPPTPPSQMCDVSGNIFMVPIIARDATGAMRTVYVAKQGPTDYYSTQQYPLQQDGAGYVQPSAYEMSYGYAQEPQNLEYGYTQNVEAQQEEEVDDGPELVGMGLYDDPPELMYSPELACQQSPPMLGRGLVLEQSFGLPEDHEDDDEEEDDEDENEDCDSAYNQNMQF